jgi:8-oxo-dGTP pyrophosphatase MutT (NUDIX family)
VVQLLHGDRLGATAPLLVATTAAIFDPSGQKVLLTRRADNGRWCLPGGQLEPGESAPEGCAREALEETGLTIRLTRLVGVYSSPHQLVAYPDGHRYQLVALTFAAEVAAGQPDISDETTAWGWFGPGEFDTLDIMEHHRERLADIFARRPEAFFR